VFQNLLQETKRTQESILQRWQSFEEGLESCNQWLRKQETAFGEQALQVTLPNKEANTSYFTNRDMTEENGKLYRLLLCC
jgi:hypothetical protein